MNLAGLRALWTRRGFAGRVATVAGGTALGQAVLIAVSPILTRLFDPDEFGVFAAYMALIALLGVVASWRYQTAIVLPDDDRDAAAVLRISLVLCIVTAALTWLGLSLVGQRLSEMMGAPGLEPLLWVVPIGVWLLGWQQALTNWATRKESFRVMGGAKASEGVSKALAQVALGVAGSLGALALLIGDVVGRVFSTLVLLARGGAAAIVDLRGTPTRAYRSMLSRYREFPLFGAPAVVLNTSGLQAPTLLFAALYGLDVAGVFALAQRVVAAPIVLLADAAAQVYLGEGARLSREDPVALRRMYASTTRRLLVLGAVPIAFIAITGEWLFGLVFGSQWAEAGVYVGLLGVAFATQFVAQPLSHTLSVLELQRWQLGWDAMRLTLVTLAIVGSAYFEFPARVAVGAFAAAATFSYIVMHTLGWIAIGRLVRRHAATAKGEH